MSLDVFWFRFRLRRMVFAFPAGYVVYAKVQVLYLLLALHAMRYDAVLSIVRAHDCLFRTSMVSRFPFFATARVAVGCAAVSTCSYLVPAGKYRRTGLYTSYMRHRTWRTRLASTSSATYWSPSTAVHRTYYFLRYSIALMTLV